jgi:hypothetical protein
LRGEYYDNIDFTGRVRYGINARGEPLVSGLYLYQLIATPLQ